MAPSRRPGPLGTDPDGAAGRDSGRFHTPGPIGVAVRLPTLELFAASQGAAFAGRGRPLTRREIEIAEPIFEQSIDYKAVGIVVGWIANAPTTLGNWIRISSEDALNGLAGSTLIHELTHIWQYQTRGMSYMSNSLCHQATAMVSTGSRDAAYHLDGASIERARSIDALTAEQQAVLVEYWFLNIPLDFKGPSGGTTRYAIRDSQVAQSMLREVRSARPLPRTHILEEAAWGPGMGRPRQSLDGQVIPWIRIEF